MIKVGTRADSTSEMEKGKRRRDNAGCKPCRCHVQISCTSKGRRKQVPERVVAGKNRGLIYVLQISSNRHRRTAVNGLQTVEKYGAESSSFIESRRVRRPTV